VILRLNEFMLTKVTVYSNRWATPACVLF